MRDVQDAGHRWMVARSHMKCTGAARAPLWCGELLQQKIEAQLGAIKRMPRLIPSFFKAPSVSVTFLLKAILGQRLYSVRGKSFIRKRLRAALRSRDQVPHSFTQVAQFVWL
jgi:hypothetical protein